MRVSEAKELMRQLTKMFFNSSRVIFSNQSRKPKPSIPLVLLTQGNTERHLFPNYGVMQEATVSYYLSKMPVTVDYFTNGSAVLDDDGIVVGYADNSEDMLTAFSDFLNSPYVTDWCKQRDIAVLPEGAVMFMSGVVNDSNYEYRSRININFYFTQKAVGYSGAYTEDSIKYPVYEEDPETGEEKQKTEKEPVWETDPDTGEIITDKDGNPVQEVDPDTGEPVYTEEPVYTPEPPQETTSDTGKKPENHDDGIIIDGGLIDGVDEEVGLQESFYFVEVDEIKEESNQ